MDPITKLKDSVNIKTPILILLCIVTAGIYPILWLDRTRKIIDGSAKSNTATNTYVIWVAVCAGLGQALNATGDESLDLISVILGLALLVLYIVWAFRAKNALEAYAKNEFKMNLKLNGFYTFFFNIYYINYCINDLPEDYRNHQALISQAMQQMTNPTVDSQP